MVDIYTHNLLLNVGRAINAIGCCNNNAYCIITAQGNGACCPLGSMCAEDPCSMTSTFCEQVVTATATPTNTAATVQVTTSTSTGCCIRACAFTMHLCDQKFGGYCCGNDAVCLPNNMCQATPNASMATTSIPTKIIVATQQCSTGSFACAAAAGGGCCPNSMICTDISSTPGCALSGGAVTTRVIFNNSANGFVTDQATETPSLTGSANGASITAVNSGSTSTSSPSSSSSSGISAGAKAGIGIGVAVAALAAVALGAFFFIRHRKQKTTAANAAPQPPPPPQEMGQYGGYGDAPGQQGQNYAGEQYSQGYYPAPQTSPQLAAPQGHYDPADAAKQQPQHPSNWEETGGPSYLPKTIHQTTPPAELPAR